MFDAGFTEMLVVAIIALLVLGPERLPGAVRTAGLTIGRIKRGFADVRNQVERELGTDELRQQLHNERIMAELAKKDKEVDSPAAASTARPASNVKRPGNQTDTGSSQTTATSAAAVPAEAAPSSKLPDDEPDTTHER